MDWLDPCNDYVFKRLFGDSETALRSMLTAILDLPIPVASLRVLNPDLRAVDLTSKSIRLDILVELQDRSLIDIEFQSRVHLSFVERMLYYWTRIYGQRLARGEDYTNLAPAYAIAWTKALLDPMSPFHSINEVKERRTNRVRTPHLQMHFLQLPKRDDPIDGARGRVADWAQFLATRRPSDYTELARRDPGLEQAVNMLRELSKDPEERARAQAREDALFMFEVELRLAREEGEARGEAMGEARGRVKGQASLLVDLLGKKFGAIPEAITTRIENADEAQVLAWSHRFVGAQSLDEIFE